MATIVPMMTAAHRERLMGHSYHRRRPSRLSADNRCRALVAASPRSWRPSAAPMDVLEEPADDLAPQPF